MKKNFKKKEEEVYKLPPANKTDHHGNNVICFMKSRQSITYL